MTTRQASIPTARRLAAALVLLSAAAAAAAPPAGLSAPAPEEARTPGLLVFPAARDTAAGFRLEPQPEDRTVALVWDEGVLTAPDSLTAATFGARGLAWPYGATLRGLTAAGRFPLAPGRYELDEPLLLTDGVLSAYLAAGEIEVDEGRILYRRSAGKGHTGPDPRGTYLLLGGLVLMTWLLLLNARRRRRS